MLIICYNWFAVYQLMLANVQLTYGDVLTLLSIVGVAMVLIILFNLIFVSISLRRVAERVDSITKDVESVILKPIGAIDSIVTWVLGAIEGVRSSHGEKKHKKK